MYQETVHYSVPIQAGGTVSVSGVRSICPQNQAEYAEPDTGRARAHTTNSGYYDADPVPGQQEYAEPGVQTTPAPLTQEHTSLLELEHNQEHAFVEQTTTTAHSDASSAAATPIAAPPHEYMNVGSAPSTATAAPTSAGSPPPSTSSSRKGVQAGDVVYNAVEIPTVNDGAMYDQPAGGIIRLDLTTQRRPPSKSGTPV
jgi:hypothetical protein